MSNFDPHLFKTVEDKLKGTIYEIIHNENREIVQIRRLSGPPSGFKSIFHCYQQTFNYIDFTRYYMMMRYRYYDVDEINKYEQIYDLLDPIFNRKTKIENILKEL